MSEQAHLRGRVPIPAVFERPVLALLVRDQLRSVLERVGRRLDDGRRQRVRHTGTATPLATVHCAETDGAATVETGDGVGSIPSQRMDA